MSGGTEDDDDVVDGMYITCYDRQLHYTTNLVVFTVILLFTEEEEPQFKKNRDSSLKNSKVDRPSSKLSVPLTKSGSSSHIPILAKKASTGKTLFNRSLIMKKLGLKKKL